MKKINRIDWFTEGFKILESYGFTKITIDSLCTGLQVTKGSFYHHFKNMNSYVEALMEYWLEENTLSIIQKVENLKDLNEKKIMLDKLALKKSLKLEQIIRAWGYFDEIVNKQVKKADKIRLDYIIALEMQTGKTRLEAKNFAMLTYAILIGLQQLFPDMTKQEQKQLQQFYSQQF